MKAEKKIRIFYFPESFPCGPASSCCGPIGQSAEVLETLKKGIEGELHLEVDMVNVSDEEAVIAHPPVMRMLKTFGAGALPVITLDEEIVSLGNPTARQAVDAISAKMAQAEGGA